MDKKNELVATLQGLQHSYENSPIFSASEEFSSKITEILSDLTSKTKKEKEKEKEKEDTNLEISELCEFMTASEQELLWEMFLLYTNGLINTLTEEEDELDNDNENTTEEDINNKTIIVAMLRKVAAILLQFVELCTLSPPNRPNSCFLTLQSLHNILVPLDEDIPGANELKQSIARLCERAWHQDEAGCELLMTQLIPFLLLNVLDSCNTRDSDVKRLYAIRDAFSLLDYEDESIQTIQGLLLRCFTDPSFLKIPEGRRFLSFTFALHADLHNLIVGVMKPQLATGNNSVAQSYGDILYRAWRDLNVASTSSSNTSKGDSLGDRNSGTDSSADEEMAAAQTLRASLEDNLQDMAHNAIHASERKYFKSLRLVLNVFHENKNNKSVDSLLLKVYGPIMWRSLRCAHPLVRMQAAIIFFDCFPLQSSDHTSNIRETEQLLQKQFDLLNTLLKDVDHRVRAVAAFGVCKILRTFWEVIPAGTTHQILSYLVSTLGVDAACANVRASVVNGMSELLENPLSHIVLKGLLPLLSHSVHDISERVRASFLRLLVKIKTTRGFKFYEIVSIDQLCNQLSADVHRPVICNIMTELLLNSFYPRASVADNSGAPPVKSTEYGVEQIKRCLQFSRSHPEAAVVFYSNLYQHTSVGSATKMFVALWNTLRDNIERAPTAEMLEAERESMRNQSAIKKSAAGKKRGSKRAHVDEEEINGTRNAFVVTVTLSHQILLVLAAILQSVLRLLVSNATYKLSKEMLLTHVSPSSMKFMLVRLLDFQRASSDHHEDGDSDGDVPIFVQSCLSQLLEVIAMVSTVGGCGSTAPDRGRGKIGRNKLGNEGGDDATSLFTSEGILSLYFSNHSEGNEGSAGSSDNSYAFSILDAAIALHKAQEIQLPKKSGKKSSKPTTQSLEDFVLWNCLKDKFIAMYALLSQDKNDDSEVSAEKNLGKRKKNKKSSHKDDDPHHKAVVVQEFWKSVNLINAILEGSSSAIVEFREEILNAEENFDKLSNIFSVMKNILHSLVGCIREGSMPIVLADSDKEKEFLLLKLENSVMLSVKLWLSVMCQRAAINEDACAMISRAAGDLDLGSDGDKDTDVGKSPCRDGVRAGELNDALEWLSNTVISAFKYQSEGTTDIDYISSSPAKSKVKASHDKGLSKGNIRSDVRSSPSLLLDNIVSSSVSVLTDALLSGIASETILPHLTSWVIDILQTDEKNECVKSSNTVNSLSRLAFAIFSTKIRYPLLAPASISAQSGTSSTYKSKQLSDMRAFDDNIEKLWGNSVDCILQHIQSSKFSASELNNEEKLEEDQNQLVEVNLQILYSMLQMPTTAASGGHSSQAATKKIQQNLSSQLIKRILKIIRSSSSVNEDSVAKLCSGSPVWATMSDVEQTEHKKSLSEVIEWSRNANELFDIVLRKVYLSESVAKFVLKILRSMLLETMQADEDLEKRSNDALLLAVLVKQVMTKSAVGRWKGDDGGSGGGDSTVNLILTAVEKLMEIDKENDGLDQQQKETEVEASVPKRSGLSMQIVTLLRL